MTGITTNPAMRERFWLLVLIALTVVVRLAAWAVLQPELGSDALAYHTMASALADGAVPVDQFGQHAFYSVGYPLALAPAYILMGGTPAAFLVVNLILAGGTAYLIYRIAVAAGLSPVWRLTAVAIHALWIPGIWNAANLARENLSTPLLLLLIWVSIRAAEDRSPFVMLGLAGACYGLALLAGGSALPLIAVPLAALVFVSWRQTKPFMIGMVAIMGACAIVVGPWMAGTQQMVGKPLLNTNSGFNLYLGHNPAATGRFVNIVDTPAGDGWERSREASGEVESSAMLGRMAVRHIEENLLRTLGLTAKKLALFWTPNIPDSSELRSSPVMGAMRTAEVIQYLLLLAFALIGFLAHKMTFRIKILLGVAVVSFWAIHGVAYIIARYRDPIMPLLIVVAVVGMHALAERLRRPTTRVSYAA